MRPVQIDAIGDFSFTPAIGNEILWNDNLAKAAAQPVGYHRSHIDYQHAYFSHAFAEYHPLDQLLLYRGEPIALWPLAAYCREGKRTISSNINGGQGVAPPLLLSALNEKLAKHLNDTWLTALHALAKRFGVIGKLRINAHLPSLEVLDWQKRILLIGGTYRPRHRLITDLTLSTYELHRQLRKSYKALINQARRLWSVEIDDQGNPDLFRSFESLHEAVAGRKTRPETTWNQQLESIKAGAAFAIYLREPDGKMIGASLYNRSRDEAYYAVGAYDRSLFDRPVAHLSVYTAIEHARNLGCKQFILGDRPFTGDYPAPNEKEAKIAFFKEGFATSLQFLPDLELRADSLAVLSLSEK